MNRELAGDEGPREGPREWTQQVRLRTPARLLMGRTGGSYRTTTQLELRRDHAAAVDAVWRRLDPLADWGADFVQQWQLLEVTTEATSKSEYLRRPDLGRRLPPDERERIVAECPAQADIQLVVGDGLSAAATARQVPRLLPLLVEQSATAGWSVGRPLVVHHCRVGILNEVGELLHPRVVILLVGERPGLATAESLSAYLAYQPRFGHTDAQRNLISNIHDRGVPPTEAAPRIAGLVRQMLAQQTSGVAIKELDAALSPLPWHSATASLPAPPPSGDHTS